MTTSSAISDQIGEAAVREPDKKCDPTKVIQLPDSKVQLANTYLKPRDSPARRGTIGLLELALPSRSTAERQVFAPLCVSSASIIVRNSRKFQSLLPPDPKTGVSF